MIKNIDFSQDIQIVEFWPWDGIFTDEIVKNMSWDSTLSLFEIDRGFYNILQKKYANHPQIKIYLQWAQNVWKIFEMNSIDYIVSSLPLAFIDKNIVEDILTWSNQVLKRGGGFIQFQYFLQNKDDIKKIFPDIEYFFTPLNLPPAFVYYGKKHHH